MKYSTVARAETRLQNNGIKIGSKVIYSEDKQPGIKLLGAISFLVNHHGYIWAKHQLGKM